MSVEGVGDETRTSPRSFALRTSSFWRWVLAAVALAAVVRIVAIALDDRGVVGGDGFVYHLDALRLAGGHGYTSTFGGASGPAAGHPPGWVTVLGVASWFGMRTQAAHQVVAAVVGLGVVVMCGVVGRRYFSPQVGIWAAFIAALYPGFWLLETGLLAEPLALLILGCLAMVVANLRERPSVLRAALAGALCGLLALVRPEQILLLGVIVVPVVLVATGQSMRRRAGSCVMAVVAALLVVSPWTLYNQPRFQETVLISTGGGGTLLAGNCPPRTYEGDLIGFWDLRCSFRVVTEANREQAALGKPIPDASELDQIARRQATDNIMDNIDRLPATIVARVGRVLAVFRPSQTVSLVSDWMLRDTWMIWAWVISFWVLVPLAAIGSIRARRSGTFQLPLVAPAAIALLTVIVTYGEPRYHSPADLGIVVLAAAGIVNKVPRLGGKGPPTGPVRSRGRTRGG